MSKQGGMAPASNGRMPGINKKRKGKFEVWSREYRLPDCPPHIYQWKTGEWRLVRSYAKKTDAEQAMDKFRRDHNYGGLYYARDYEMRESDE